MFQTWRDVCSLCTSVGACPRLGEIRARCLGESLGEICDWQGDKVFFVSKVRSLRVRGGYTPSLTLYAKTWDVWSICTSVEAHKSVPDLERL